MNRFAIGLLSLLLCTTFACSDDTDRLKPYVDESTALLFKVDADRLYTPAFDNGLEALSPQAKTAITVNMDVVLSMIDRLAAKQRLYATVGLSKNVILIRDRTAGDPQQIKQALPNDALDFLIRDKDVIVHLKDKPLPED